MKKSICVAILFSLLPVAMVTVKAQDSWSLQRCIRYAVENNLQVKQQQATCDQQEVQLNTAQHSMLPNLSGSVSQSFNFGRGLQADNTYANTNTSNTSFDLSTNVPLFTGLQITHTIVMNKLNLQAAMEDLNKAKEDISIQVASQYLNVLYNQELVKVAEEQARLSEEQANRLDAYFHNGKASEAEVLQAQSTLAQDQLAVVQTRNDCRLALLDLTQLLELESPEGFAILTPADESMEIALSLPEEVYTHALVSKPAILAAEYRVKGADRNVRVAQSAYYPSLYLGAGLSSGYYHVSTRNGAAFGNQLKDNFNRYVGLQMSIPLFNRFQTRNSVRSAHIQQSTYSMQLEETKKTLYKEIQQAYYNAVASQSKYSSSQTAVKAGEASFRLMTEKYENGKATATEYNEVKTSLAKATSNLIQAKYEYLFRAKILDFYKGVPIALKEQQ